MMKISSFLLMVVTVSVYGEGDLHYIDDCLKPGSNPDVYSHEEIKAGGVVLHVQELTLRVPEVGFTPAPITCISVINLESDIVGGYPSILEGGVGYNYVIFFFKSQLSRGFDFDASVYYDLSEVPTTTTQDPNDH